MTGDDGSVTEKETTIYADGSIGVRQTTTDGEGYQSGIEMSVSADGSDKVTLTLADAGGSETVETVSVSQANEDGSTTHTEKVTETTKDADGKVTDTKTTTTESTATSTEHADGSVTDKEMVKTTETGADGSELVTGESIRETTTHADGSSVENVSETPDLGDTYGLDDAGGLTPDPEGAEGDNYKEIVDDVSSFIQDNTGVNNGDAVHCDVSVLLGGAADAGNVWLNTNEETDAEGEVINQDASLTVKQTGTAAASGEASGGENGYRKPSAQIAIGASTTSGSNSGNKGGKWGGLYWEYSENTLTITGKGAMKGNIPWSKYKGGIKTVKIRNDVTSIASKAFQKFARLIEVNIASSVTSIGSNAFQKCKKLKSVNIARGSRLITIGKGAFDELNKLSKVTLPASVTRIAKDAFKKCKKISVSVRVPAGKVLSVKIDGVDDPQVIIPTSGMADITSCLFWKRSNRNSSCALVLKMVVAGDGGGTSGARSVASGDGDDSGADGDDSGDDGDDSGDGGDTGSGVSSSTQNMGTPTVTFNFSVKGAADNGAAYDGNSKVTAGKNSLALTGVGADRSGSGSRAAAAEQEDDEIEIVSGKEYKILRDGYIVLNFYTPDADITVNSIVFRRPGDANNDGYVNAADLVEIINAKNGHASERFNLTNADIDRDGIITQNDIDIVVKLIMEQTDEK